MAFFSEIPEFRNEISQHHQGKIPTIEEFRKDYPNYFFNGSAQDKGRSYIILHNTFKEEIGHLSYTSFHLLPGISEFNIWLNSVKYMRKGYGLEAIQLLRNHLFSNGYHTIIMRPSKRNTKVIEIYEKAGFYRIRPDYTDFYKAEFIEFYVAGDWGKGLDEFMICKKTNR